MKRRTIVKNIVGSVLFLSILFTLLYLFELSLTDYSQNFIRIQFNEYYDSENIDTLIIGTSPVIRGLNVPYMDEQMEDENVFSLATSTQLPIAGYYLLKDAIGRNEIKQVICQTSYSRYIDNSGGNERPFNVKSNYIILDNMRFSIAKLQFAHDALGEFPYVDLLSKCTRKRDDLTVRSVAHNLKVKLFDKTYNDNYGKTYYDNNGDFDIYMGKGYSQHKRVMETGTVALDTTSVFRADSEQIEYLKKTIELCQENGIDFVLINVPYHPATIYENMERHNESEELFHSIADEYHIPYWNFNLVTREYLDFVDDDFYDRAHLTKSGSDKFTPFFVDIYKDYRDGGDKINSCLYKSFDEYEKVNNKVYGVEVSLEEDNRVLKCATVTAKSALVSAEYKYQVFCNDQMICDTGYITDDSFHTEVLDNGKYRVVCCVRTIGSEAEYEATNVDEVEID